MTLSGELAALARSGVQLWVEGDKLMVRAPKGSLTPDAREMLTVHKDAIVHLLRFQTRPDAIPVDADQGIVSGPVPLTPPQHEFFYSSGTHRFNRPLQPLHIDASEPVDPILLKQAVDAVIAHHDALRMRFSREGKVWKQRNLAREHRTTFSHVDLGQVTSQRQEAIITSVERKAAKNIDIFAGPLIHVLLFTRKPTAPDRITLIIHHLVMDLYSIVILRQDLGTAYRQLQANEPIRLPAKTTSYKAWAENLSEYAASDALGQERQYWLSLPWNDVADPPVDFKQYRGPIGWRRAVRATVGAEQSRIILQTLPARDGIQTIVALLAALSRAYMRWTGGPVQIEVLTHGRQPITTGIDVSRTVGWFTAGHPVLFDWTNSANDLDGLRNIQSQWQAVPNGGVSYTILRSIARDRAMLALPASHIRLNYRSQLQELSSDNSLALPAQREPVRQLNTWFPTTRSMEWRVRVEDGQILLVCRYHAAMYRRTTIQELVDDTIEALRCFAALQGSPQGI